MDVCIFYATEAEVTLLQSKLSRPLPLALEPFTLHFICTGVGLLHATGTIMQAAQQIKPALMLQIGIAGSFNKQVPLGNSFLIQKDAVADEGVWEQHNFIHTSEMSFCQQPLWFENSSAASTQPQFPVHHSVTVNTITTEHIAALADKYQQPLETMEGAALHWAGNQLNIPYFQVRGVSNYVGERNKANWKFQEAITNSNEMAYDLLVYLRNNAFGL